MNHWCHAYGTKVTEGVTTCWGGGIRVFFASFAVKCLILLENLNRKARKEPYTCRTSPSRATNSYKTGFTKKPMKSREISPATMTMAKGF